MALYSIVCRDYDIDFGRLAQKRLAQHGVASKAEAANKDRLDIDVSGDELEGFHAALAELVYKDLRCFELARLVGLLPASLRDKRDILPRAMGISSADDRLDYVVDELKRYLDENHLIVMEGFIRFRLPDLLEYWAMAVDRAGEELLIRREYEELLELLNVIADIEGVNSGAREVRVILHKDGGCTVSDEGRQRIDCAAADGSSVVGMLIGMAPKSISVYDLTGGEHRPLMETINMVFGKKARFFVKK